MDKAFKEKEINFLKNKYYANFTVISSKNQLPISYPVLVFYYNQHLYITTLANSKKINHLLEDNRVGVTILDPKGYPYLSISGYAIIHKKNDFLEFAIILRKLYEKYLPPKQVEERMNQLKTEGNRVLLDIRPKVIFGTV